ncbi:antibiotic biosynthesis monooxygenase family protein [Streptomyces sp. NPDC101150]|uniref:antibiotic biosynthesis monooxygenase family protein n=1 Tax=Streptomyces sp. NPDC101150 TaxID=3366114 RepID=UPI003814C049
MNTDGIDGIDGRSESASLPRPLLITRFPDVPRADAATALVSSWIVPEPTFQRPAADAILGEWERQSPPEAMLSLGVFLSADGGHLLNYGQWTSDDAHREWVRTRRPAVVGRIDTALPGIRRPGLVRYRRYRSHVPPAPAGGHRPTLLVTPAFATTGPDAQRALADTVLAGLTGDQVPGLLGAHLHLSQDGDRVLTYAEWADPTAWREFAAGGASTRLREAIEALDGVTPTPVVPGGPEVAHYRLYKTLANVPSPETTTPPRGV